MRDYVVVGVILLSLPFCIIRPYIGVLMWCWVSYMNPHRLTWSFAYHFPAAQCVAIATILGLIGTKERQRVPIERETILLLSLWLLFTLNCFLSIYPDIAWAQWLVVTKILLMTFITMFLVTDRKKFHYLLLTIALSLGFYGLKGGIFSVVTGGTYLTLGPPGSFIADNNDLALALLMVLPLLFYLAQAETSRKLKFGLMGIFFFSILTIIFSYSRGGLLGLAAVMTMFVLKFKKKFWAAIIVVFVIFFVLTYAPEAWFGRMQTLQDYFQGKQLDPSATGRINAWHFAWNLASARPLTGGGFGAFSQDLFALYAPDPNDVHAAHSIYFEILGEQGFIALGLFLVLLASSFWSLRRLKRAVTPFPNLHWMVGYSDMLQLSLTAYIVSGAFLGRAYFDLFYHLIAAIILLRAFSRKEIELSCQREFSLPVESVTVGTVPTK